MWRLDRLGSDRGFTLVELLVAMSIAIALLGITVTLFTSLLGSEPRSSSRSAQLEAGRVMLERTTRELRQGVEILPSVDDEIVLTTSVCDGTVDEDGLCSVTYACSTGSCTRTEGSAQPTEVATGLDPAQTVFDVDSSAGIFVEIRLSYPQQSGAEAVTLTDGVALRNYEAPVE